MPLILRNPHSVLAALETRPQDVLGVHVPSGASGSWEHVRALVQRSDRRLLGPPASAGGSRKGRRRKGEPGREGGAEASVKPRDPVDLDALLAGDDAPRVVLALDRIQDPHNVGAIFRTAAFFGVRGIVLTRDRSAPLTAAVYDVASGGVEHVPFAVESNLSRCVDAAKAADLWVLGTSERAHEDIRGVDASRAWLVVLGSEDAGLRKGLLEQCDEVRAVARRGAVGSLNVSVAAGVILSALLR